jgi:hypothetical protein
MNDQRLLIQLRQELLEAWQDAEKDDSYAAKNRIDAAIALITHALRPYLVADDVDATHRGSS